MQHGGAPGRHTGVIGWTVLRRLFEEAILLLLAGGLILVLLPALLRASATS
jgi:hypothetical protein